MKYSDKDSLYKPRILYSDNHICVVIKPANMVVPDENKYQNSLEYFLKEFLKKELKKETLFLRPIHRLDKPVEGIVIFARSSKALKRLQDAQQKQEIKKFYLAKVCGSIKKRKGVLEHRLIHGDHRAEIVSKDGKIAKLNYRVIQAFQNESFVSIRLHTGRYHQIRIQLASINHPIIGDIKYGAKEKLKDQKIMLCHTKIIFEHPVMRTKMTFIHRPEFYTRSQASGGIQ